MLYLFSLHIQNLKTPALIAGEKSVINFMREKNKWTNKENDKHEDADSFLQLVIPNVCTKFQNPKWSSS